MPFFTIPLQLGSSGDVKYSSHVPTEVALTGLIAVLACFAFCPQAEGLDDAKLRMLIELLGADFLEEREPARKALEKAGKTAEPRLVEALSHADHRVRRSCLELLTLLKSTAAMKRAS